MKIVIELSEFEAARKIGCQLTDILRGFDFDVDIADDAFEIVNELLTKGIYTPTCKPGQEPIVIEYANSQISIKIPEKETIRYLSFWSGVISVSQPIIDSIGAFISVFETTMSSVKTLVKPALLALHREKFPAEYVEATTCQFGYASDTSGYEPCTPVEIIATKTSQFQTSIYLVRKTGDHGFLGLAMTNNEAGSAAKLVCSNARTFGKEGFADCQDFATAAASLGFAEAVEPN